MNGSKGVTSTTGLISCYSIVSTTVTILGNLNKSQSKRKMQFHVLSKSKTKILFHRLPVQTTESRNLKCRLRFNDSVSRNSSRYNKDLNLNLFCEFQTLIKDQHFCQFLRNIYKKKKVKFWICYKIRNFHQVIIRF